MKIFRVDEMSFRQVYQSAIVSQCAFSPQLKDLNLYHDTNPSASRPVRAARPVLAVCAARHVLFQWYGKSRVQHLCRYLPLSMVVYRLLQ